MTEVTIADISLAKLFGLFMLRVLALTLVYICVGICYSQNPSKREALGIDTPQVYFGVIVIPIVGEIYVVCLIIITTLYLLAGTLDIIHCDPKLKAIEKAVAYQKFYDPNYDFLKEALENNGVIEHLEEFLAEDSKKKARTLNRAYSIEFRTSKELYEDAMSDQPTIK